MHVRPKGVGRVGVPYGRFPGTRRAPPRRPIQPMDAKYFAGGLPTAFLNMVINAVTDS